MQGAALRNPMADGMRHLAGTDQGRWSRGQRFSAGAVTHLLAPVPPSANCTGDRSMCLPKDFGASFTSRNKHLVGESVAT